MILFVYILVTTEISEFRYSFKVNPQLRAQRCFKNGCQAVKPASLSEPCIDYDMCQKCIFEQVQSTKHFSLNILISFSGSTSMQDEAVDQWFLKLEDIGLLLVGCR